MNIRNLEYLIALTEEKHFGKAARRCHISQPTLSMQFRKLEEELGVHILERRGRRFLLTPQGQEVAEKAREILKLVAELYVVGSNPADQLCLSVRLGLFPTIAPYLLPIVMPRFKALYPQLPLHLVEEKSASLLAQLEHGALDAAMLALPRCESWIATEELFTEPFMLALPEVHPLAARNHILVEEIAADSLLLLDEGHCLREQSLDVCRRIGVGESQNYRATSLTTLLQMVASGAGVTFVPQLACMQPSPGICFIPLRNPTPTRTLALCWRNTSSRTHLMKTLAKEVSLAAKYVLGQHNVFPPNEYTCDGMRAGLYP